MKTEKEVAEKYEAFLKIKDTPLALKSYKEEIEFTISALLWVLKCEDCKSYPCTCNDPF